MKNKIVFLFCLSVLTFINSFKNPFMLDDYAFFGSGRKQSLGSFFIPNRNAQLKLDSPQTDKSYYRPLAHVIPQVSYRLFGSNVAGHHALNLLLMWLVACAVYVFLRSFFRDETGRSHDDWFAFCVAAFFITHPINGILINYITASVFSVQVALMLGSLTCLSLRGSRLEYAGAVVCFILALFCHETAVLLPVYAVLVLGFRYPWRVVGARVAPLLVVVVVYFVFRFYASPFNKSILYSLSILDLTLIQQIATVFKLLSWYVSKLLAPWSIFLMWSTPFVKDGVWLWAAGGVAVIGLFAAAIWVARKNNSEEGRRFLVFFLWFLLGLTPIAAGAFVTPYVGGLIEPHWFVFATVGFFALMVLLVQRIQTVKRRNGVMAVVIGLLVILSWKNNHLWSQEIPYYQAWLKDAPQFKAIHYFLGIAYVRSGEFDKAYPELEQTILGRYKDWMVYLELGQMDLKRRDFVRAKKNIMSAYQLERKHSGVLNAVGALHYKLGEFKEAKDFFERSIVSNSGNLEPYMNLGLYYKKINEPQKAAEMYRQVLKINSQFTPARQALQSLMQLPSESDPAF